MVELTPMLRDSKTLFYSSKNSRVARPREKLSPWLIKSTWVNKVNPQWARFLVLRPQSRQEWRQPRVITCWSQWKLFQVKLKRLLIKSNRRNFHKKKTRHQCFINWKKVKILRSRSDIQLKSWWLSSKVLVASSHLLNNQKPTSSIFPTQTSPHERTATQAVAQVAAKTQRQFWNRF